MGGKQSSEVDEQGKSVNSTTPKNASCGSAAAVPEQKGGRRRTRRKSRVKRHRRHRNKRSWRQKRSQRQH